MAPSGMEPANFRLIVQCLKQRRRRVPHEYGTIHNTITHTYTYDVHKKYLIKNPLPLPTPRVLDLETFGYKVDMFITTQLSAIHRTSDG